MLNQDSQEVCEISQSMPSSLQEAFFNQEQHPALSESNEPDSYSASSPSQDSVDAAHFKLFQESESDTLISMFSQISPSSKNLINQHASVKNLSKYGVAQSHTATPGSQSTQALVQEPINVTGSLELPRYDPKRNFYQSYWQLFLRNDRILSQIEQIADSRDSLLREILQIEEYYDDEENLARATRERYLSGRKKHNRRCANEI